MDAIAYIFSNIFVAWPSILMGAAVPCAVLLALLFSRVRKRVPFNTVFHGIGSFLMVLAAVAVLFIVITQVFFTSVTITEESDANHYIYIGGLIILAAFYAGAEFLKLGTFDGCCKAEEKNRFAGLTFGSGFALAQNLLVLGLVYAAKIDLAQSVTFGLLMIISGIIYLLVSEIGYELSCDGHRYVGFALASGYYIMFAVMLFFTNVYITYTFVGLLLIFYLVMGYVLLPLPFKKKGGKI